MGSKKKKNSNLVSLSLSGQLKKERKNKRKKERKKDKITESFK